MDSTLLSIKETVDIHLKIKVEKCVGCGKCVPICPVQAISIIDKKAVIDRDACVECSTCYRIAICPNKAIRTERLKWPRLVRNPFSDVVATHKLTGVPGRGTEEMKTNDVTGRFKPGELGFSIELGRPGVGTRLGEAEKFTTMLSKIGVQFEEASPLTSLIVDEQGHVKEDIKKELVLSTIIEFKVPQEKLHDVLDAIKRLEPEVDTVFSVGVITRVDEDGSIPVIERLNEERFNVRPNAKVNIGLGQL
ncbi:MAG: DUF362 domain-containing protein [Candidatus Hodarchaeota archaeon]